MEHVHRFLEFCYLEDAMFNSGVNSDLQDARTDRTHGFPIGRHEAALHLIQFESGTSAGVDRKSPKIFESFSDEGERLQILGAIY